MSDSEIIKIPQTDKWIGSCPECGKNIWASYLVHKETENIKAVYKCILCNKLLARDEIIPF